MNVSKMSDESAYRMGSKLTVARAQSAMTSGNLDHWTTEEGWYSCADHGLVAVETSLGLCGYILAFVHLHAGSQNREAWLKCDVVTAGVFL
jgi:hypothetical protein